MHTYRLEPLATPWATELTTATLAAVLADAAVIVRPGPSGRPDVTVRVTGDDHQAALADIEAALRHLGWQIADAIVQEWLDKAMQTVVLAAVGGIGGSRITEELGLLGVITGLLAGALAPPLVRAAEYHATRTAYGWQLQHVAGIALRPRPQVA